MTTTLTRRLAGYFLSLASQGRKAPPRLESLNLSAHELADLNLPPDIRTRLDILRLQNLGDMR